MCILELQIRKGHSKEWRAQSKALQTFHIMRHFALTRAAASKEIKAKMKLNATLAPTPTPPYHPSPCIPCMPRSTFSQKNAAPTCKNPCKTSCARSSATLDSANKQIEKSSLGLIYFMWQHGTTRYCTFCGAQGFTTQIDFTSMLCLF